LIDNRDWVLLSVSPSIDYGQIRLSRHTTSTNIWAGRKRTTGLINEFIVGDNSSTIRLNIFQPAITNRFRRASDFDKFVDTWLSGLLGQGRQVVKYLRLFTRGRGFAVSVRIVCFSHNHLMNSPRELGGFYCMSSNLADGHKKPT